MDIIHPGGYDLDTKWIISGYISRYLMDTWIQSGYRGLTKYPWILSIKYPSCIQSISTHIQILSMDTHLRIQKWIRIRQFTKLRIHGYYLDTKWIQRGYEMDTVWIRIRGYFMDTFWIQRGYKVDTVWICIRGYFMDTTWIRIHGYFMDTFWILSGYKMDIHYVQDRMVQLVGRMDPKRSLSPP